MAVPYQTLERYNWNLLQLGLAQAATGHVSSKGAKPKLVA